MADAAMSEVIGRESGGIEQTAGRLLSRLAIVITLLTIVAACAAQGRISGSRYAPTSPEQALADAAVRDEIERDIQESDAAQCVDRGLHL